MKKLSLFRSKNRGSALLATMIIVMVLSVAAMGIMDYSISVYRNSLRQALTDQAKEIADSEMENLYYTWKDLLLKKTAEANIAASAEMTALTSSTGPFSQTAVTNFAGQSGSWTVSRSIAFNPIGTSGDGSAEGVVGNNLIGKNYYFTAQTSASITLPLVGTISFRSGRHFAYSSTPLFQYAVFYQGDLEMAAGGNMNITGPVSTNASAYLGSASGYALQLSDTVAFFQNYNGAADPTSGEHDYLEGTSSLVDPVYNPDPTAAAPSDQAAQRAIQVQKLTNQASFTGGVDVAADIANPAYAQAYTNLQGVVDPNEVYRAVIAPPPADPSTGALYAEDPVVAESRMYNTAAILVTVDGTSGVNSVHIGTAANPSAYDSSFSGVPGIQMTGPITSHTAIIQGARTAIIDPREELNGATGVNLTTLDVGNLGTVLNALGGAAGIPNYNGIVYVYDKTDNTAPAVAAQPGVGSLNGIRITDATTTPNYSDQNGNPIGFTIVSNNGVYVQGNYNTTQITVPGVGTPVNNPSAVMGDAVTVLSAGWDISHNTTSNPLLPITQPNAAGNDRQAVADSLTPWNQTVNAAILTGNTPSTETTNSGGAQNLVRMIEDWYYPTDGGGDHMTLTLDGSLGQLFTSKYFAGSFAPGQQSNLGSLPSGGYNQVYIQPRTRNLKFDTGFKERTPAGAPTTTNFSRGDFFFW